SGGEESSMKKVIPSAAVLSLAMALLVVPVVHAGGTGSIHVGQPFPPRVFPSAEDGSPQSLSAYTGRKVVLHVFASW
ncbi:MAG: hypothetical protein O7D35_11050, partial [Acidobacteria bacterium]|nr:hypothetical protein [Acidobacteriota bacterium]